MVGEQKGGLQGEQLLFAEHRYICNNLKINSHFYEEALRAITKLDIRKHFSDIKDEHLYYNKIFSTSDDDEIEEKTVKPFTGNRVLSAIKTYGDLLAAENTVIQPKLRTVIKKKIESIAYIRPSATANEIIGFDFKNVQFKDVTQKYIYSQLIQEKSLDHIYQSKWVIDHPYLAPIEWTKVWDSLHQYFFTEDVKSTIWAQIHLNFYTTYNYNKWHNALSPCPLCRKIPEDVYHILLDCQVTNNLWKKMNKTLTDIIQIVPSAHEKVFGFQSRNKKETDAVVLRNWLTFSLRHYIMKEERRAYYLPKYTSLHLKAFIKRFNYVMQQELKTKCCQQKFLGLEKMFERISTINSVIGTKKDGKYIWNDSIIV